LKDFDVLGQLDVLSCLTRRCQVVQQDVNRAISTGWCHQETYNRGKSRSLGLKCTSIQFTDPSNQTRNVLSPVWFCQQDCLWEHLKASGVDGRRMRAVHGQWSISLGQVQKHPQGISLTVTGNVATGCIGCASFGSLCLPVCPVQRPGGCCYMSAHADQMDGLDGRTARSLPSLTLI
jgi:hypothetical protein